MRQVFSTLVLVTAGCAASRPHESTWVAPPPTASASMHSCFVLRDATAGTVLVREGDETCERPLPPASTFKVPHALIALETQARRDGDDPEAWNGIAEARAEASRDQTLTSAIRYSVLWYFQKTAERIGLAREREWLTKLRYGNAEVGDERTLITFWLKGPLLISADQQAEFMARYARGDLPVSPRSRQIVDDATLQQPGFIMRGTPVPVNDTWGSDTRFFSKTGSMDLPERGFNVRWLVGHIEKGGRQYAFASVVTAPADVELSNEAIGRAMPSLEKAGLVSREARR